MKCPRCHNDNTIKFGKKDGLTPKQRHLCKNCKHMFYIKIGQPTPKIKRFSVKRETLRQIIHADLAENPKEYQF